MSLHARIAAALGWTVEETRQFSFQALRELIRPVSAKLAGEIGEEIRSGAYQFCGECGQKFKGRG